MFPQPLGKDLQSSFRRAAETNGLAACAPHVRFHFFGLSCRPDCCLLVNVRRVTWRRFLAQKRTGHHGCHIASVLLGLSQSRKLRTSMVGPYQIQTASDRAGGFHGLVASTRQQGGLVEIDGLRSLRLLRSGRVRSERRCTDVVRFQSRIARTYSVRSRGGTIPKRG